MDLSSRNSAILPPVFPPAAIPMNVKPNTLFTNDNLFVLNGMNSECVDLIYLDPPFNSKRFYSAPIGSKAAGTSFKDMWSWDDVDFALLQRLHEQHPDLVQFVHSISGSHGSPMRSYITYMAQRVLEIYRVLKPTGSLYFHCDPTASHYIKIMLDFIFGVKSFRNEIVWCYRGAGYPKKDFGKRHDILFRYSKSDEYVFNLDSVRDEYAKTTRDRFKHHIGNKRGGVDYGVQTLNSKGRHPDDWWQIQPIAPSAKERTGYPTQKPLALLNRIIQASSNEGDMVFDPFCGCATTCVAAQHLHRQWIGIDVEKKSGDLIAERLADDVGGIFTNFIHRTDLPQRTDCEVINLKNPRTKTDLRKALYGEQEGRCNGCKELFEIRHFHIDHIVPRKKGGGDFRENLQLLCGNCNSRKGARPMEYLNTLINRGKKREFFTW